MSIFFFISQTKLIQNLKAQVVSKLKKELHYHMNILTNNFL